MIAWHADHASYDHIGVSGRRSDAFQNHIAAAQSLLQAEEPVAGPDRILHRGAGIDYLSHAQERCCQNP
jgi:CMP-2-keto-3-deoxyoctulosonic acid synthetase